MTIETNKTGKTSSATIKQIAPSADDMTKTVLVKLSLKNTSPPAPLLGGEGRLSLGTLVKVYFNLKKDEEASDRMKKVVLPRSFLRYEYGQPYVWIWNQREEKAEKRNIELGECNEKSCEIESGVKEGEMVVRV